MNTAIHQRFKTIDLDLLNKGKFLSDRLDHKYAFALARLDQVFEACLQDYRLLQIAGNTVFTYHTWYFDTPGRDSYHDHHRGKSNRYKLRFRHYEESAINYLELKINTNKGRTHKERKLISGDPATFRLEDHQEFLFQQFGLNAAEFVPTLRVSYKRSTLLHQLLQEKVTIDWGIQFADGQHQAEFKGLAIAEAKTPKKILPQFHSLMRLLRIREVGMSKYCMGSIALHPDLKYNAFKPAYRRILNIIQNEDHVLYQ